MKPLKRKHRSRLLAQIAADVGSSASLLKAAAAAAHHDVEAGRDDEALRHLLEVETEAFNAQKLITLASYVGRVGGK